MVDISVILVTYNCNWESLRITLLSILKQKKVSKQIIIADDGSEYTFDVKIQKLMEKYSFENYSILNASTNRGTVLNIANAMKYVKGKYTKTIAPGDFLFDETTLYYWTKFMATNDVAVSFGDAVYYFKTTELTFCKTKGSPVNKKLFKISKSKSKCFVDYLVANDTILGAAQLMKTDILNKYLNLIKNKIIYAEDYMIRLMVYDGISIVYYPSCVIWYEYGTGISTSRDKKWERVLHTDFDVSNNLILERKSSNFMQKKFKQYLLIKRTIALNKLIKILLFPSVIIYRSFFRLTKEYIALSKDNQNRIKRLFCWLDE